MTVTVRETRDLATCLALRRIVFIDEQGVSEAEEVDGLDGSARHLLALVDGVPLGTARILIGPAYGKIGRVCVLAEARGQGLGAALIRAALDLLRAEGVPMAKLGAQTHALGFYAALGFTAEGPEYMDAGIPHRDMTCRL